MNVQRQRPDADTLLIIGVHRAELAFGRAVADALPEGGVDVLAIPEGLSGAHPRPDEVFRYETMHRALYGQVLGHIRRHHRLVIDLHAGSDSQGPCADVFTASAALREGMAMGLPAQVRVWGLGADRQAAARAVVPVDVWGNPAFDYVVMEIYLSPAPDWSTAIELSLRLIERLRSLSAATPVH